jgi:hypothetical protein
MEKNEQAKLDLFINWICYIITQEVFLSAGKNMFTAYRVFYTLRKFKIDCTFDYFMQVIRNNQQVFKCQIKETYFYNEDNKKVKDFLILITYKNNRRIIANRTLKLLKQGSGIKF